MNTTRMTSLDLTDPTDAGRWSGLTFPRQARDPELVERSRRSKRVGDNALHLGRAACRIGTLALLALAGATIALAAGGKAAADSAKVSAALTPEGGRIVVEAQGLPPAVPVFFSAIVEQTVKLGIAEVVGEARLKLHVVQGRPEVFTLGLSGDGEVFEVSGAGLRDWSVRQGFGAASDKRFLDLRPQIVANTASSSDLVLVVRTRLRKPTVP